MNLQEHWRNNNNHVECVKVERVQSSLLR